jgi:peptide/nickel transport system ATP-binding protein
VEIIVENLKVFPSQSETCLLDIPYLALNSNEITGLWGPSGSGKSTFINCLNGLVFFDKRYRTQGHIRFEKQGKTLLLKGGQRFENIQKSLGVFTILQFLYEGLSPLHTIGTSIFDMVKPFYKTKAELTEAAIQKILTLGLPADTLQRYPDTLSGGEIQRCQLMSALLSDVSYFLLDEATSALDRENSLLILHKLVALKTTQNCGSLLVSHDRQIIEQFTDRILTIENGRFISEETYKIEYPNVTFTSQRETLQQQKVLLQGIGISKTYLHPSTKHAVNKPLFENIQLIINESHFVGLCGPSGSGKSTLGKILAGLESVDNGSIQFEGLTDGERTSRELKKRRLACPFLYQDALQSFHPAYTMKQIIRRHMLEAKAQNLLADDEVVGKLMAGLDLHQDLLLLYPHQLSGGQAQRFQLLLALIFNPKILIMDEPFSFLDSKTVDKTMQFLHYLREKNKLSVLCISHQTELLFPLCDAVMQLTSGSLFIKKTP